MKYIGKNEISGAEIRESERLIPCGYGRQNIVEFEVWINDKFKARFKELAHALNSISRSYNIEIVNIDKFFDIKEDLK